MIDHLAGAKWFKSTYSGADKACVEAAFLPEGAVGVRDSKDPAGPALIFGPETWDAFTSNIGTGRFPSAS